MAGLILLDFGQVVGQTFIAVQNPQEGGVQRSTVRSFGKKK